MRQTRRQHDPARFSQCSHTQFLERVLHEEAKKQKQDDYVASVKRQAKGGDASNSNQQNKNVQSRTVEVKNVANLDNPTNFDALQEFLETTYGPVESCVKFKPSNIKTKQKKSPPSSSNGKVYKVFPHARVRFVAASDAQKLFGGTELCVAKDAVSIPCRLGTKKGCLTVVPYAEPSDGKMADEESLLQRGQVLRIKASSLALGHWCPRDQDMYLSMFRDRDCLGNSHAHDVWVEEICLRRPCEMSIDLLGRKVEISTNRKPAPTTTKRQRLAKNDSSKAREGGQPSRSVLSFRFKELWNEMEICGEKDEDTFDRDEFSLVFALKHPPKLENVAQGSKPVRRIDYPGIENPYFGRCRAFKLVVTRESMGKLAQHDGFPKLFDIGVLRSPPSYHHFDRSSAFPRVRSILSLVLSKKRLESNLGLLDRCLEAVHDVDDHAGFALRAAVDQHRFSWHYLLHDRDGNGATLPVVIAGIDCYRQEEIVQLLKRICDIEDGRTNYPLRLFEALMVEDRVGQGCFETATSALCIRIPRLLLTPCQTMAVGFETEITNRVLRYFVHEQQFSPTSFLRVSLGDENGQQLYGNDFSRAVEDRFRQIFRDGISINGKTYRFIAYSSSQLRECSFWMVRLQERWTVDLIRRTLGDFSRCTSASKYAARIGQCFSTTVASHCSKNGLKRDGTLYHREVPDIPAECTAAGTRMIHSDGTGLISRRVLDELLSQVPFAPKDPRDVSIIQIRFGGAKGTLTAWEQPTALIRSKFPAGDASQSAIRERADIMLRGSMQKFEASYEAIEICGIGSSVPYYLNRNVILILSCLGIPDSTLLELQREMLNDLDAMLTSSEKARELLPRLSGPDAAVRSILNDMLVSNLAPQDEPFLFSCLHAIRSHHLFRLRKKSRILITDGAVLMGGVDETGLLPEGCVFVHSSRYNRHGDGQGESCIVVGPVMVTKHPVMHIGDVRMLLAIYVPQLKNHRNVILFSQKGQRPEPNKMAGSDLDGDEFAVTWDSRLFLKSWHGYNEPFIHDSLESASKFALALQHSNEEPLAYADPATHFEMFPTAPSAQNQALIDHFIDHSKKANLGRIATLWQDYASRKGAACQECHELAHLHSIAVDFPKSGVAAVLPNHLALKPEVKRAHWREVKRFPVFHCKRIVGRLYDEVISHTDASLKDMTAFAGRDTDRFGQVLASSSPLRVQELEGVYDPTVPGRLGTVDDDILEVASRHRELYEVKVTRLMHKYKIRSEGELMTGFIRKLHKLQRRREHPIAEEIRRTMNQIRSDHRRLFLSEVVKLVYSPEELVINRNSDEEVADDDILSRIEEVVTRSRSDGTSFKEGDLKLRREAFRLAAAYYVAAYAPSHWESEDRKFSVRFSCPWVVCSDVIAAGLAEACPIQNQLSFG